MATEGLGNEAVTAEKQVDLEALPWLMPLGDVREADYLLKTQEQVSQEMQQSQEAQKMAAMMEQKLKTESNLVESQKDFVEETALNEQTFGHDLVLEAVKQNAASEKAA